MILQEFKSIVEKDLLNFYEEYTRGIIFNSEFFPLEMEEGDWYNQFLIFLSNINNGK